MLQDTTFLLLQLTGDWKRDNMAAVNKRKVLTVEGKVSDTTNRKWKKESEPVWGIWFRKCYDPEELGQHNQNYLCFEWNGWRIKLFRKAER